MGFSLIQVSWCIYRADGAANLGDIWDLVYLSKCIGACVVSDPRPRTGTNALAFSAVNGEYGREH